MAVPFAFLAIYDSQLPIKCPKGRSKAVKQCYNFERFYSAKLLAVVDARCHFTSVSVGAPGNTHYSTYFQSTDLWHRIEAGLLLSA